MRRTSWGSCSLLGWDVRTLLKTMVMSCSLSGSRGRSSTMISAVWFRVSTLRASSCERQDVKSRQINRGVWEDKRWHVCPDVSVSLMICSTYSIKLRIEQIHLLHCGKLRESTQVLHDPLRTAVLHAGTCRRQYWVRSDWTSLLYWMLSIIIPTVISSELFFLIHPFLCFSLSLHADGFFLKPFLICSNDFGFILLRSLTYLKVWVSLRGCCVSSY